MPQELVELRHSAGELADAVKQVAHGGDVERIRQVRDQLSTLLFC